MRPADRKMFESPSDDLRNGGGRPCLGTAAHFIGEWITPVQSWSYLDIAGMAWNGSAGTATSPSGATGFGECLFDRDVRDHREAD